MHEGVHGLGNEQFLHVHPMSDLDKQISAAWRETRAQVNKITLDLPEGRVVLTNHGRTEFLGRVLNSLYPILGDRASYPVSEEESRGHVSLEFFTYEDGRRGVDFIEPKIETGNPTKYRAIHYYNIQFTPTP